MPTRKIGLGLEAILTSLSRVCLSIDLFSYKSQANLVPKGYPHIKLINKTKLQLTGSPKGLHKIFPKILEYILTPPQYNRKFAKIKKMNKDGKTL